MSDFLNWFYDPTDPVLPIVLSVVTIFIVLGVCTRFGRLRSLSQMTGFDFGVNVAVGSIIAAAVLSKDPSVFRAAVALVTIFAMQIVYSTVRRRVPGIDDPSSQPPHVVYVNGAFIEDAMAATKFSRENVFQAVRAAGLRNMSEVAFVIAEPTGNLNVFGTSDTDVQPEVFMDVVGRKRLMGGV